MILKGNIRAGGQELASHLLNAESNERVELAEINGFAAEDLHGALAEVEAIATGTKSTKPLYSLSINPSQEMTREQYGQAIDKIADKLGLENQPRAVVFHIKNGREHAHVVFSRIDAEKMQARHMEFDHQKLREVARELVRDFGHEMPKHLGEDRGTDRYKDKFNQATLAEQGQQARSGIAPEERRDAVKTAYEQADSAGSFRHALSEQGYTLAQGDKRGFVVVDRAGDVHALTRQIEGVKAKEIEAKLSLKAGHDLPSVQEAKDLIARQERHKAEIATQERPDTPDRVEVAQDALKALTDAQKAELKAIKGNHTEELKAIREAEAERIDDTKRAIKEAYRPEWADMFKRQRDELKAIDDKTKTATNRISLLLKGQAGDAFDFENRSTLAGAFNFIVRGQVNVTQLEKRHKAEKAELSDGQKLAEREEVRAIKQETKERRRDAQDDFKATISTMKSMHADELVHAVDELETARKLSERDGTDLSQGEKHARDSGEGSGFGFSRQGFKQTGFGLFSDKEREEDEPERVLKPPGQNFTP
jgi:hypothetical protein